MNLLPASESEFAKAEFWNKFFRKRGSKEFEWYGEYEELKKDLIKYLKREDVILVVGCGNSMLSASLFDDGYRNITNIDVSPVAISQMRIKVGKKRPEMIFEQMDALNMSYEESRFNVVIDKGTLDALIPTDTRDDRERARKLFIEIDRVLRDNGRYIIISLLQRHVLEEVLNFFHQSGYMVRILRCWDAEKKRVLETGSVTYPVFVVVCVKMKKAQNSCAILEVNILMNGKFERVETNKEAESMIEGLQNTLLHCKNAEEEIEMKFCKVGEDRPRYSVNVVDGFRNQRQLLKYAAFIVPHGRETEWMFATREGRRCLRESSGFDRLALVSFHRNQSYGSLEDVQDELREVVLQLAPPCMLPTTKIPFLTLGDGVGRRKIIYSGTSNFSGEIVVEEVEIENETFRRLIFMSNQAVVQSEVKLLPGSSEISDRKKVKSIDSDYVASNHIFYMSVPAGLKTLRKTEISVAILGLGGGSLCLFLRRLFPKFFVTGVEIDPLVVEIAEKFFGFQTDEHLNLVVGDGLEFLKNKPKLDILMFDLDSKELGSAISCPPPQFVESSTLKAVADILGSTGIFVTNVVSRMKSEHKKLIEKIRKHFALVAWYDLKEEINRIVYASNFKIETKEQWKQQIKEAAFVLHEKAREQKVDVKGFDLNHLGKELSA